MTELVLAPFTGSGAAWNAMVAGLPGAHLLQTWEWAQVKAAFGWQAMPYVWVRAAGKSAWRRRALSQNTRQPQQQWC